MNLKAFLDNMLFDTVEVDLREKLAAIADIKLQAGSLKIVLSQSIDILFHRLAKPCTVHMI
jgi:hypothetical protein